MTSDGSVWASGSNNNGQLGDGTLDDRWVPVLISEAGFNWKTSTPRLAPSTGTYSAPTSVTVSAVTPAAEIHYTTNGLDPTPTDPTVSSGGTVIIDQSVTLNTRAWATGMPVSNVAAAVYTMVLTAPRDASGRDVRRDPDRHDERRQRHDHPVHDRRDGSDRGVDGLRRRGHD